MANKAVEFTIRGSIDWCKLIGPARPHTGNPKYDKGPSWSVEINPDEKSRAKLKQLGLADKLKRDKPTKADGTPTKNPRSYDVLRLSILETKPDGSKNKNPEIQDGSGRNWGQEVEIGNGSVADVLVRFVDYGTTQGLYYKKMRVLKHVVYEGGSDFEPLSEDDEFFAGGAETAASFTSGAAGASNPDALDDDIAD